MISLKGCSIPNMAKGIQMVCSHSLKTLDLKKKEREKNRWIWERVKKRKPQQQIELRNMWNKTEENTFSHDDPSWSHHLFVQILTRISTLVPNGESWKLMRSENTKKNKSQRVEGVLESRKQIEFKIANCKCSTRLLALPWRLFLIHILKPFSKGGGKQH